MGKHRTLLQRLAEQLEKENPDKLVLTDRFSDDSASWIEIRPAKITVDLNKEAPYYISTVLSFNGKGTKLCNVRSYRNRFIIEEESEVIK